MAESCGDVIKVMSGLQTQTHIRVQIQTQTQIEIQTKAWGNLAMMMTTSGLSDCCSLSDHLPSPLLALCDSAQIV